MNQMPCSATFLERETDAGTRPLIRARRDEENEGRDRPAEVQAEIRHICRVIAGLAKDTDANGETRMIRLDNEVACGVIDREGLVEEIVTLICAGQVNAFTVTDAMIVNKVAAAVLDSVAALADARVPA